MPSLTIQDLNYHEFTISPRTGYRFDNFRPCLRTGTCLTSGSCRLEIGNYRSSGGSWVYFWSQLTSVSFSSSYIRESIRNTYALRRELDGYCFDKVRLYLDNVSDPPLHPVHIEFEIGVSFVGECTRKLSFD